MTKTNSNPLEVGVVTRSDVKDSQHQPAVCSAAGSGLPAQLVTYTKHFGGASSPDSTSLGIPQWMWMNFEASTSSRKRHDIDSYK